MAELQQPPKEALVGKAHKHSSHHRAEVLASAACWCFYCGKIFPPCSIKSWCDKDAGGIGQTAICPKCGVDSVIGEASGFEFDPAFFEAMHARWFGPRGH